VGQAAGNLLPLAQYWRSTTKIIAWSRAFSINTGAFAHIDLQERYPLVLSPSCRNNIRWSYHRTRCERAAVCLCVLVVCLSRDCPPFVDHLGLAFVVLLATRSCTGMGSNQAARSARYLLSACAPVVSHATAFGSRFVYNKARYVFVSRFCRTDSRHQAHREF
jgi:hypothetical protein